MPDEKWLKTTVTISREELADIISSEINEVLVVAKLTDESLFDLFKDFLPEFTARIASRVFHEADNEEEREV